MYNIEQLRMLVETVETGSFSACAKKIGKVQSAVSQGIANLEIDLNLQLFDRSTRKPTLTSDGERIYKYAQAIIFQSMELEKAAKSLMSSEEKSLKIAVDESFLTNKFYRILTAFNTEFPFTEIDMLVVSSPDVSRLVVNNDVNMGLMYSEVMNVENVDFCGIGKVPFCISAHPQHPLTTLDAVQVSDLMSHQEVLLKGQCGKQLEFLPRMSISTWWSNSFTATSELLMHNIGWAYLPCHIADIYADQGKLVRLSIAFDHKPWSLPVDIVTTKGQIRGPAMAWLFEQFKTLLD